MFSITRSTSTFNKLYYRRKNVNTHSRHFSSECSSSPEYALEIFNYASVVLTTLTIWPLFQSSSKHCEHEKLAEQSALPLLMKNRTLQNEINAKAANLVTFSNSI